MMKAWGGTGTASAGECLFVGFVGFQLVGGVGEQDDEQNDANQLEQRKATDEHRQKPTADEEGGKAE